MMPNCKEHENCDLICSECGSYYCQSDSHNSFHWVHVPHPDMPDDSEEYYNRRAEEMP